jgi:hypothetical protein
VNVPQWRAAVESGTAAEARSGRPDHGVVVCSAARARVIADLLDELAARIRPGATADGRGDVALSGFAKELAVDMYHRAGLPAPR